jgi:PAS domain S-box-containing protein
MSVVIAILAGSLALAVCLALARERMRRSHDGAAAVARLQEQIAQRRQIEQALAFEQSLLGGFMDNAPEPIFFIASDGRFLRVNKAFAIASGGKPEPEAYIGLDGNNFENETACRLLCDIRRVIETGQPMYPLEYPVFHVGEMREVWYSFSLSPLRDEQGEVFGVCGICHEITGRRHIEEALRESRALLQAIVDNADTPITCKDRDGIYYMANPAFESLVGAGPGEVMGKTVHDFFPPDTAQDITREDEKLFATGVRITRERFWDVGGRRRWLMNHKFPLSTPEGEVYAVCGISTETTREKELAEEAARAAYLASLGELAAGLAHEINNPVAGVIGYAERIEDVCEDQESVRLAGRIIAEAERVAAIVRSLLDFARGQSGVYTRTELAHVVDETMVLTQAMLLREGIEVRVDVPDSLPAVMAKPGELVQVLLNLVSNARQALARVEPGAERRLEITAAAVAGHIELRVGDTGPGIPESGLERVMESFYTTRENGTGLGLSICRRIARQHGGELRLESAPDRGLTAIIELPPAPEKPAAP